MAINIDEISLDEYDVILKRTLSIIQAATKRLTISELSRKIKTKVDDTLNIIYDLQSHGHHIDILPTDKSNIGTWDVEFYGDLT